MQQHFVYIIKSQLDGSYHKGYSTDPWLRLQFHNLGKSIYTSKKLISRKQQKTTYLFQRMLKKKGCLMITRQPVLHNLTENINDYILLNI